MERLAIWVLRESWVPQVTWVREEWWARPDRAERRGLEDHLESEEFQGPKESLALPVQMAVREFLACQDPGVFRVKMALPVKPVSKDFLGCQVLMDRKASLAKRVFLGTRVLLE